MRNKHGVLQVFAALLITLSVVLIPGIASATESGSDGGATPAIQGEPVLFDDEYMPPEMSEEAVIGESITVEELDVSLSSAPSESGTEIITLPIHCAVYYDDSYADLALVNKARSSNGVARLGWDSRLETYARMRAVECTLLFSHDRPDGSAALSDLPVGGAAGENIALSWGRASDFHDQWMNSSGHRGNILNSSFRSMATATVKCGKYYYSVEVFSSSSPDNKRIATGNNKHGDHNADIDFSMLYLGPSPSTISLKAGEKQTIDPDSSSKPQIVAGYYGSRGGSAQISPWRLDWYSYDESIAAVENSRNSTSGYWTEVKAKKSGKTQIIGVVPGSMVAVMFDVDVYAKPTWSGASKMPISSTATYTVKNGSIKVKSGGDYISVKGNTVTAKKKGTATLALLDRNGKEIATKKVEVYKFSGEYVLESAVNSDYVLDIRGKSTKNSAQMIVWTRNGGKNQKYSFHLQSDGTYGIRCVHSRKWVDVQGGGTKKSQRVIQYSWNGGKNQRWKITVDAKNRITFVSAKSGMVFDVRGGKAVKGKEMIQYPFNNGNNQKWWVKRS